MSTRNHGFQGVKSMICAFTVTLALLTIASCGGGTGSNGSGNDGGGRGQQQQVATPSIAAKPASNGAQVVSLSTSTVGATIYYTLDGTAPTSSSTRYFAPFLISKGATLNAIGVLANYANSAAATQTFAPSASPSTLMWSEEFSNSTGAPAQPDPTVWTYDTGNNGFGNGELETYCAWGSTTSPCDTARPNAYVGTDGYLHIVARNPSPSVYTSARLKTQGLFSFQYGRLEFRAKVPEAQGFWPAGWLLGNDVATVSWPACGEQDVMERVNVAGWQDPLGDWNAGSIHGTGFIGSNIGTKYHFATGDSAANWHVYGMIWSPQSVQYYIDTPTNVYASFTTASLSNLSGSVWPFDKGDGAFMIFNLAVGGSWPGSPDVTTPFPSEVLIDWVRIYNN